MIRPAAGFFLSTLAVASATPSCPGPEVEPITVRVIRQADGAPLEAATVIRGLSLEEVRYTDEQGEVVIEASPAGETITVARRYSYVSGGRAREVTAANTFYNVEPGQVLTVPWTDPADNEAHSDFGDAEVSGVDTSRTGDGICVKAQSARGTWTSAAYTVEDPITVPVQMSTIAPVDLIAFQTSQASMDLHGCSAMPYTLGLVRDAAPGGTIPISLDVPFVAHQVTAHGVSPTGETLAYNDMQVVLPDGSELWFTEDPVPLDESGVSSLHLPARLDAFGQGTRLRARAVATSAAELGTGVQIAEMEMNAPRDVEVSLAPVPSVFWDFESLNTSAPWGQMVQFTGEVEASGTTMSVRQSMYDDTRSLNHRSQWFGYDPRATGGAYTIPLLPGALTETDTTWIYYTVVNAGVLHADDAVLDAAFMEAGAPTMDALSSYQEFSVVNPGPSARLAPPRMEKMSSLTEGLGL